jgi:uncharacterized protein (TIGR00255 family)
MINSMTGYGEASGQGNNWTVSVKIKTLNHRYLDLQIQGLDQYKALELPTVERLKSGFHRGRIEISIQLQRQGDSPLMLDVVAARQHHEALKRLAHELQLSEEISLDHLLRLGGAVQLVPPDPQGLWPVLEEALGQALAAVQEMRRQEGEALASELAHLWNALRAELLAVEARAPELKRLYRDRLQQRIHELSQGIELDADRIEQEVALWAERSDITEEIARLKIHLDAAAAAIRAKEPAGRTLDFLAQEMHREVNTMAAKARDGEIAQRLIEAKAYIERVREQVRNIE